MDTVEINNLWLNVKATLFAQIPESDFPWINALEPAGYTGGIFTVITEKNFAQTIVRTKYLQQIKDILKQITGNTVDFEIIVDSEAVKKIKKERQKRGGVKLSVKDTQNDKPQKEIMEDNLTKMQSTNLNLKYKFENFVVGENSKTAYAIAKMVAENPAEKYNPLFIYGGSGLGKTHLMHAIGRHAVFHHSKKNVKYIKTQDIINQYMSNMKEDNNKTRTTLMSKFRQKYKTTDILLIDDIQFIESKKRFMDELFDIIDTLLQANKQVVLTSDRLPKDIPTIPDRLRTRFEMGIVVDIKPPPTETRIEILKQWSNDLRLNIPDEVFEFIAQNFTNNVRELEGVFNKVTAISEIEKADITLEFVRNVLKTDTQLKKITIEKIAETVAEFYNVTVDNLKSPARTTNISEARRYTIYLAREMTKMSYVEIAEFLNKKHPTMLYSYEKIVEEADRNVEVKETIRELKQAVKCSM